MKKFLFLVFLAGAPAAAFEVNSQITDSVQLTVEGPAVQSNRIGASYGVSGTNINATSFGGVGGAGTYDVNTSGQAFSFSESFNAADTVSSTQAGFDTNGRIASPNLYGETITQTGGTPGSLAGTLSATGSAPTVTAGGPGTTAIGQRVVELSVFK
jgi:hypothetical protein